MRKHDKTFLEDLENELKSDLQEKVSINSVSQLKGFPFKDYNETCQAFKEKRISFSSDYSYERLTIYATKSEILWHNLWLALPFIIIILNIILAVVLKEYILLVGFIASLLGYFSSSPYFKLRNALAGLITIISIIYILINWRIALIFGSYALSLIFTITARETFQQVIINRAIYSETFFVWLFLARALLIRDNNTMKLIQPID